jgi:hypothetical protein
VKVFSCGRCGQWVFFENVRCERCGAALGYLPAADELIASETREGGWLQPLAGGPALQRCANGIDHGICNWLVDPRDPGAGEVGARCASCRLTRTAPDLTLPGAVAAWERIEQAKRYTVRTLLQLGLPVVPLDDDPAVGLAFDLLGVPDPDGPSGVITGHADGVITIDVAEASDHVREARRTELHEPYRTMLGHVRHEVGHRTWEVLVRDDPDRLAAFRAAFGDEQADYTEALARNYEQGPPPDWSQRHVSAYAASHPWEDWAETWAHLLHIVDALETSDAYDLDVRRPPSAPEPGTGEGRFSDRVSQRWLPVAYAVNAVNRSLGEPDLYPFVLSPVALAKLDHVDALIAAGPTSWTASAAPAPAPAPVTAP